MFGWFKKRKEEKARLKAEEERMRAEAETRAKAKLEAEYALEKQNAEQEAKKAEKQEDSPQAPANDTPAATEKPAEITEEKPSEKQNAKTEEQKSAAKSDKNNTDAKKQGERPAKKPAEKPSDENSAKKAKPVKEQKENNVRAGKWIIEKKAEGEYISRLKANNGEIMLTSESYTTAEGAKLGISTIIKNVEVGKFIIYPDKKNNYYYKLKTAGNKLLCVGEIYSNRASCENAAARVKLIAGISPVSDEMIETEQYIQYVPDPNFQKAKAEGKWKIVKNEIGYVGKLYASNGELLLATEGVSSDGAVKSSIENVRANAKANNFVIDRDKSGRYYYKLRNTQKSTLCVGESYETLAACSSAIESVKKFCESKIINEAA